MAAKRGTPLSSGIIARATAMVSGAVAGAIRGAAQAWFGPGEPLPDAAPSSATGRQFDYPIGFNYSGVTPRSESSENAIDFPTLRAMAEPALGGLDLLRLAIETRKDQMEGQRWKIVERDGEGDGGPRARDIERQFRRPDGVHTQAQWQRMLLEDMFVIDAASVYLRPQAKGADKLPEVMDGGTLKLLIDGDGRVPLAPDPAFQQILVGLPAISYSIAEVIQLPRNLRSNRAYGCSPVEQVITTINIALRRQQSQLEYYTAGSVPDAIANVPESWTLEQTKMFQAYWDSILSGNTEERRRLRFVPGDVDFKELAAGKLKDEYDEWLARVICFCFSLSPQAFVKQMNRATAGTAKEAAQEEGLEPIKNWFKDLIDLVLEFGFNEPDLEMQYIDEEVVDPVEKATIMSTALGAGGGKPWLTVDEVRAKYGELPMTPEQKDELMPPPPPQLMPGEGTGDSEQDGTSDAPPPPMKVSKARGSLRQRPPAGL